MAVAVPRLPVKKPWKMNYNGLKDDVLGWLETLAPPPARDTSQFEAARENIIARVEALPSDTAHVSAHGTGEGAPTIFVGEGDPLDPKLYGSRRIRATDIRATIDGEYDNAELGIGRRVVRPDGDIERRDGRTGEIMDTIDPGPRDPALFEEGDEHGVLANSDQAEEVARPRTLTKPETRRGVLRRKRERDRR